MLRDVNAEHEVGWASEGSRVVVGWQTVDRELRRIAKRRAALDAEEAHWLREADRCRIWRELGMVSALDYLERVLGYEPHTAKERLRVARKLGGLPVLTAALAHGELAFSAVRELTRVVTPSTEAVWCEAAVGKNLREVEELVEGHKRGDRPEDPKDPKIRRRVLKVEVSAETFALWRQARQALDREHGTGLSDDEMIAAMCNAVLGVASASEPSGRAKYQVAMVVCARCAQGWQEGAGVKVAVAPEVVDRAMCDAQHVGVVDGSAPPSERAHQDIAPSVARLVWRRDGGRCRVPGCRSSRGLELHHIVHRADGGGHEAENLVLLCSACHAAHHRGRLQIRGRASGLEVDRCAAVRSHVGPPSLRGAVVRTQAKEALTEMGWRPAIAAAAVKAAAEALGEALEGDGDAALRRLIVEALRRCPRVRSQALSGAKAIAE